MACPCGVLSLAPYSVVGCFPLSPNPFCLRRGAQGTQTVGSPFGVRVTSLCEVSEPPLRELLPSQPKPTSTSPARREAVTPHPNPLSVQWPPTPLHKEQAAQPTQHQISILLPNSTTELLGKFRKSAAPLALWCICANSFSRHGAMPPPMVGITVSRDRK